MLLPLVVALACRETTTAPVMPVGPRPRAAANVAPEAVFAVSPRWPKPGDTVTFDASYAFDRDGRVVAHTWDLGNGVTQVSGATARTVYRSAGTFTVQLTAQDDSGATTSRTLSLTVSAAGAPASAVSAALSSFTLGGASVGAASAISATVIARNAAGQLLSGVPVLLGGQGRSLAITQPPLATDAAGVATGTIGSVSAQSTTVRAIADFTLLNATAGLTVTAGTPSAALSRVRVTDPILVGGGDSTLVEVTAVDANGNAVVGANVSVTLGGGTAVVRNEGPTDANGRRIVTVLPTTCGGIPLTVGASIGGVSLSTAPTITSNAPAAYGICGEVFWLDAATASSLYADAAGTVAATLGGRVQQVRDRSGAGNHVTARGLGLLGGAAAGAVQLANAINGRTALQFDSTAGQFRRDTAGIALTASGYSLFVVYATQATSVRQFGVLELDTLASSDAAAVWEESSVLGFLTGSSRWIHRQPPGLIGGLNLSLPRSAPTTPIVGSAHFDGSTTGTRVNRGTLSSSAATAHNVSRAQLTIGNSSLLNTRLFTGAIGEVVIFSRTLSAAERDAVEGALMAKWGIGTLSIDQGNNQVGASGSALPLSPRVRLVDASGNGIPNATVTWQVASGGGSVTGASTTTDANGYASVGSWTLGGGTNTLTAWLNTTAGGGQSVTFTATGSACAYGVCGTSLWFDASDATTVTQLAGLLTGWQDKSGLARHATPLAGPQVVGAALNGRTAMRFNGSTQVVPITDVVSNTAYTAFVVDRRRSSKVFNMLLGGSSTVNGQNLHVGYRATDQGTVDHFGNGINGAIPAFTSIAAEPGRLWAARWTTGARSLAVNNAVLASDATSTGITAWSNAAIGRFSYAGGTSYYDGDVGEVLFFGRALSDAERSVVSAALMVKWGLGSIAVDAGNGQSASIGTSVATNPRVRVTDAAGNGLAGATITWQVTGGGGSVAPTTSTTDASGYASTSWTLGAVGTNTLVAWYSGTAGTGQSVSFTATGLGACAYTVCGTTLWLDANVSGSFTTESGSRVTQWRDQSGYANHGVATSLSSMRPTYSASGYFGRPAVVFAGGSNFTSTPQHIAVGQYPWQGASEGTALIMWSRSASNNCERLFDFGSSTTVNYFLAPNCGSHRASVTTTGGGGEITASAGTNGTALDVPILTTIVHGSTMAIRVDGLQRGVSTTAPAPSVIGTPTNRWIGRSQYSVDGYLSGAIAELVFFPRALTTTELQSIERALLAKWGGGTIAISSGNAQSASAGSSPALAPTVRVTDASGAGIAGSTVTWTVSAGGGRFGSTLTTLSTTTDASGFSSLPVTGSTAWTLDAGSNGVTAALSTATGTGRTVTFTATGTLPTGLVLRLDADNDASLSFGLGNDVSGWDDLSGQANNASQIWSFLRPALLTNQINGRAALDFNGFDEYLNLDGAKLPTGVSAATMYVVGTNSAADAVARVPLAWGSSTTNAARAFSVNNRLPTVSVMANGTSSSTQWTTTPQILMGRFTGGNTVGIAQNGGTETSATRTYNTSSLNAYVGRNANGGDYFLGRIGEVLVFNTSLNSTDRQIVDRYLGWKWGISVP